MFFCSPLQPPHPALGTLSPQGPPPTSGCLILQGPLLPLLEQDRPTRPSRKGAKDIINADHLGKSLDSWCVA